MSHERGNHAWLWGYVIGALLLVLPAPIGLIAVLAWPSVELGFGAALACVVLPTVWWIVAVPMLNASKSPRAAAQPPARRAARVWVAAWWPFAVAWFFVVVGLGAAVGTRLFLRRWPSVEGFEFWYIWPLLVLPLFGGVFSYVLRQRIMRAAHRGRVCYYCGSDLSGVQDSGRCAECGTEVLRESPSGGEAV